jgi:hypothetical protein
MCPKVFQRFSLEVMLRYYDGEDAGKKDGYLYVVSIGIREKMICEYELYYKADEGDEVRETYRMC